MPKQFASNGKGMWRRNEAENRFTVHTTKFNKDDSPSLGEGMSTTHMIAVGGGIAAVAAIGIAAMTKKNKGGGI